MKSGPAEKLLKQAVQTYKDRRSDYGDSEKRFADAMIVLFPNGIHLQTHDDFVRYGLITQVVGKLVRYVTMPYAGHVDSIHDLGVYSFMLEAEDRRISEKQP